MDIDGFDLISELNILREIIYKKNKFFYKCLYNNFKNSSVSCLSRKKFLKYKDNKNLSKKILNILVLLFTKKEMLNKINYDNLINNFA